MKVLCTHNTKPGRLPRLLTYFILQAAEFIRPHRMHRIDAAYCCTCPTFRDPCLCACWTPECVVQKRINRSSAGLLTGGDSLGPMEACITRGVQKYLHSTSLHSADMRCWNRFNQEGIQVLFPSSWLYIPTGRNWDPWPPQRICSKLFKWGGLTYLSGDSRETSFLFQRLSMLIQRFNSALIVDSFCFSDEDPDL